MNGNPHLYKMEIHGAMDSFLYGDRKFRSPPLLLPWPVTMLIYKVKILFKNGNGPNERGFMLSLFEQSQLPIEMLDFHREFRTSRVS